MTFTPDTVFVTGGTGFLGRHLLPALCRAGFNVRLLTRHATSHAWIRRYPHVEIVEGDVQDASVIGAAMQGCRYVIHGAGLFRFWGNQEDFDHTNVGGTENVLKAALAANVERMVHISTVAVIGTPDPNRMVDEMHPANPADPYQQSKLRGETLALRYHTEHHLPVIILRPGAFYGPLGQYAFNRLFFRDPMRGLIMQINGGRYITFPAYVPDVARMAIEAFTKGRCGEVYNICDESLTHKAVFDIITREAKLWYPRLNLPGWMGVSAAYVLTGLATFTRREPFYPINLRSYVYNYWRVSNDKARRELDFVPTPFAEGARRTIAWYRTGQPEVMLPETEC